MTDSIELLLRELDRGFYWNQVMTILFLFLIGLAFLYMLRGEMPHIWAALLAYPMGLSLWCLSGVFLTLAGIRLHPAVMGFVVAALAVITAYNRNAYHQARRILREEIRDHRRALTAILCGAGFILVSAMLCCLGIFSVSLSNDSMYYYSLYPNVLAMEGGYRDAFDVFLTDVGQGTAMLGTLPFFFGFDQIFGIQHMLNLNFILIFVLAVFEQAQGAVGRRGAVVAAILGGVVLSVATPYIILSKWIMSNDYFMIYFFIVFYLALRNEKEKSVDFTVVTAIFAAMLSLLRMEGGMMLCFIMVCISVLNYSGRELITGFLLPVWLVQGAYYIKLFFFMNVDPVYRFLDWRKALIQTACFGGLLLYFALVRKRLRFMYRLQMPWLILGALILGNLLLLLVDPGIYLTNLRAFGNNFFHRSGWGLFIPFAIILFFVMPVEKYHFQYVDLVWAGYILFAVAVLWARDGSLREGVGDSGNRVMLQVVPFILFGLIVRVLNVLRPETEE